MLTNSIRCAWLHLGADEKGPPLQMQRYVDWNAPLLRVLAFLALFLFFLTFLSFLFFLKVILDHLAWTSTPNMKVWRQMDRLLLFLFY